MSEADEKYDLQIVLCSGPESPEKATLAVASGLSGVHSGLRVKIVLAMRGAVWAAASEGNSELVHGYPSMGELMEDFMEEGGVVFGCSSCIDQYCPAPRDDDGKKVLRKGIDRVGLSLVTLRMTDTPTVTF